MKELGEDFKEIAKKDRNLIVWMVIDFLLSVWLFMIPLLNLNSGKAKIWARYSDINDGYAQSDWWYLISFSVIALTLGVGHILLSARLYSKRGKDIARLFLAITMIVIVIGIKFLSSIVGEG